MQNRFLIPFSFPVLSPHWYQLQLKKKAAIFPFKILWVLIKSKLLKLAQKSPHNLASLYLPRLITYSCILLSGTLTHCSPGAAKSSNSLPLLSVFILVWHNSQLVNSWNVTLVLLFPLKAGSCYVLWSQSHIHTSTTPLPARIILFMCLFVPEGRNPRLTPLVPYPKCLAQCTYSLVDRWGKGLSGFFYIASVKWHMARPPKCASRNLFRREISIQIIKIKNC